MNLDELIARLAETPARVRAAAASSGDPRRKTDDETFSVVENVCHLRDIEAEGYVVRIRRLIDEVDPLLDDIDGTRLAIERRYNEDDLATALAAFADARARSIAMLHVIDEQTLRRTGRYAGEGEVTLGDILARMIEHDEGHIRDIEALR